MGRILARTQKNEIVKLEYMISKMRVPFQELGKEWLTLFQTHDLVKNLIEENKTLSNLIKENKTLPISPFSPNFIEEIHTKIEKNGKKYLDLILKENLSFLDSPNDFYEFISFFSAQLFRTKKYRDALLENSNDLENIWGISSLILATNLSNSIMIREFKVILCKNTTTVKFITTDYPIINIFAKLNKIPEKKTYVLLPSFSKFSYIGWHDNIGKKNRNYHNFILTPHTAWIGLSTIKRAWNQVLENIENFKKGKPSRVVC